MDERYTTTSFWLTLKLHTFTRTALSFGRLAALALSRAAFSLGRTAFAFSGAALALALVGTSFALGGAALALGRGFALAFSTLAFSGTTLALGRRAAFTFAFVGTALALGGFARTSVVRWIVRCTRSFRWPFIASWGEAFNISTLTDKTAPNWLTIDTYSHTERSVGIAGVPIAFFHNERAFLRDKFVLAQHVNKVIFWLKVVDGFANNTITSGFTLNHSDSYIVVAFVGNVVNEPCKSVFAIGSTRLDSIIVAWQHDIFTVDFHFHLAINVNRKRTGIRRSLRRG